MSTIETIYNNGQKTQASYLYGNNLQEAKDYPTRIVDLGGNDRQFTYDSFGRLKTSTDLGNGTYTFTYGEDGLSKITSPTGETLQYDYDQLGNLAKVTNGDGTIKQISYRATDNRLGTITLPGGETITYDYDNAGRTTSQTSSTSGTVSFTYTRDGQIASMTDSSGTTTYHHDDNTVRLSGIDSPNGSSIAYTYDLFGRVKTITEKGSATGTAYVTEYDYDAFGNLKSVKDPTGGVTLMKYDVVNRLVERILPNGIKSTYAYDELDRVSEIVHTNNAGDVLASVTYERSGIGEPTKITREDGSYVKLEYDEALRVKKESYYQPDGTLVDETFYTYDADGKRITQSTTSGNRNYSYTPGYQLDTISSPNETENYDYDTNGRLTLISRDGQTKDLNHDVYDRLTEVENETTGRIVKYIYDGAGNRIKAVEGTQQRSFLVAPVMGSGLQSTDLIADNNGNLISNYIYAGGSSPFMRLDANGNPVYYLTDAMGTTIGLANGTGTEVADFRYDSFGNLRGESGVAAHTGNAGGDFRFQGQWLESESGLYYFRARDYDSKTGLFLSRDPVDIIETEPESFNPYQFVYNNPYIYSDPTGMFTIAELNSSFKIQNILQTYVNEQARDFLRQQTGELFGNIALGIINQIFPRTADGEDLFKIGNLDPNFGGTYLEDFLQDNLCSLLPNILKNRLWLTPAVNKDGEVEDPGFQCNRPRSTINNISNPDFLFEEGSPQPVKNKNPQSYLIGDIKYTISQAHDGMKAPKKQWLAMANHAQKYQFLPFTSFITFRTTVNNNYQKDPTYQLSTLKNMQEIAVQNHVALFIVNIFD